MKGKIVATTLAITVAAAILFKLIGWNPSPIIGIGIITIILLYALLEMPEKHKTFSYRDQLKGMLQSRGGNPPPEAPHPDEDPRHRKERESA